MWDVNTSRGTKDDCLIKFVIEHLEMIGIFIAYIALKIYLAWARSIMLFG